MKHRTDPRQPTHNPEMATWHGDPNMAALVADIIEKVKPRQFVESGSNVGWGAHSVASRFPELPIMTVELDSEYFRLASENLEEFKNVLCVHGDSRTFLRELVPTLTGPTFFWLDAHWGQDHPLREECAIVAASTEPCIVLVDDYHCGDEFPGDIAEIPMVEETLGRNYFVPAYAHQQGYAGYCLHVRGVGYVPPPTMKHRYRGEALP